MQWPDSDSRTNFFDFRSGLIIFVKCNFLRIDLILFHMKFQIKTLIAVTAVSAAIATGCSGAKENRNDTGNNTLKDTVTDIDIKGQWYIENIVFNDSDYVRPDEATPGVGQYITFEDGTFFIMTNCNSISGTYTIKGDSITLGDGAMTEMACDNMATEDALRRILPDISTIDVQNDSVIRLNGSHPAECILLHKANPEIK